MQLISEEYRILNKKLHAESKEFGNCGAHYLKEVATIIRQVQTEDVLDYGCGKSSLANNLPFPIKQYDPAIEKYSAMPEPADLVICTDVIEHLEPEYLDNVLKHIASLTKKYAYLIIAITPAQKSLPDGRNTHLIVHDYPWWFDKLHEFFHILTFQHLENRFSVVVQPKKDQSS